MPSYGPTYQQYREAAYRLARSDESGHPDESSMMSEEDWNALSDHERHRVFTSGSYAIQDYELGADDPNAAAFRARFGDSPEAIAGNHFELNNERQGGLRIGYANDENGVAGPEYGRADWNQLAIDPSRILWLDPEGTPGRRYIYEGDNRRGDVVVQEQARADDSGLGDNFWIAGLAMVVGGGMLANSLLAGAEAGAAAGSTNAATGAGLGGSAGEAAATSGMGGMEAGAGLGGSAGEAAAAGGMGAAPTEGLISTAANAAPAATAGATPGAASSWWSTLSPSSQSLLTRAGFSAASTGASAMLQGVAQRNAQEFATNQADRAREDRRGEEDRARDERLNNRAIVARNITVTPRSPAAGIIGSTTRGG